MKAGVVQMELPGMSVTLVAGAQPLDRSYGLGGGTQSLPRQVWQAWCRGINISPFLSSLLLMIYRCFSWEEPTWTPEGKKEDALRYLTEHVKL